jgi:hypothetical protein
MQAMKRYWLLFSQWVTVLLAAWFVVATLQPDWLRLGLSAVILLLAIWLGLGLGWRPQEIYTVHLS